MYTLDNIFVLYMSLCQYRNIFGKPGEGVHSYRIFNIAIVDLGLTLLVAYLLSVMLKKSFALISSILLILGVVLHRLFCVRTTVDKLLFP